MKVSCACGKVDISVADDAKPMWSGYCHCESCRRAHAATMVYNVGFPAAAITVDLENAHLGSFKLTENGPNRYFCKECGNRVFNGRPGVFFGIMLAGLPNEVRAKYPPTVHVNYEDHIVRVQDGLPKFRKWPPMKEGDVPDMMEE